MVGRTAQFGQKLDFLDNIIIRCVLKNYEKVAKQLYTGRHKLLRV